MKRCEIPGCKREALKNRIICEYHAFPAGRNSRTDRRAAIKATREKKNQRSSKDSDSTTDKENSSK